MQAILNGTYAAYNSSATLKAALSGGLHFEIAPQGANMTYAVYTLIDGVPDYMLAGEYAERIRIQFDIYAETNAFRQTAYQSLISVYDDAIVSATGYSPVIFERKGQQFVRDGQYNEVFRAIVDYQGSWKKN